MSRVPSPWPSLLAEMLPWWASMSALLMVSPMPEPVRSRVRAADSARLPRVYVRADFMSVRLTRKCSENKASREYAVCGRRS